MRSWGRSRLGCRNSCKNNCRNRERASCGYCANSRQLFLFLFLMPSLLGVSIFVLVPFLDVAKRSFQTAVTGQFCGLRNYQAIFHNRAFRLAVGNTARFVGVGIPLLLVCSLGVALLMDGSRKAQVWKAAYLFPLAVPTAAVVLVWKLIFHSHGLLNGLFGKYDIAPIDWLGSDASFWVLILSYLWKNMGYTIVLWMAGLYSIPPERREAAKVDGASGWQCFLYVLLPELAPMAYTITVLSFLNSFKVYREAYLVAGVYPQERMYLLQHLFNNWFTDLEMDKIAAGGMCVAAVFLAGAALLRRLWDRQG